MFENKRWMRIGGIAAATGLLLAAVLVGTALAQRGAPGSGWGPGGMMGGQGDGSWGGMMGGSYGQGPGAGAGYGPGACHGAGAGWGDPGNGDPISLDEATQAAQDYIAAYGDPDLELAEVMAFTGNYYAQARETSTGRFAFEVLIDRYNGAVYPEPGPNMMWNTKYGHMGGWMGGMMGGFWGPGWGGDAAGEMTVTPEQARELAQEYLDAHYSGLTVGDEADAFYGYYTLHTLSDGTVSGMLSVNGYSGQVWYHTWHGDFIEMTGHEL
jgi:hypothetical protein